MYGIKEEEKPDFRRLHDLAYDIARDLGVDLTRESVRVYAHKREDRTYRGVFVFAPEHHPEGYIITTHIVPENPKEPKIQHGPWGKMKQELEAYWAERDGEKLDDILKEAVTLKEFEAYLYGE